MTEKNRVTPPYKGGEALMPTALGQLTGLLAEHGIDTNSWGTGAAKTVRHLLDELHNGECALAETVDGNLLRTVVVAGVDVYHDAFDGRRYRLIESRQVFADGRTRVRQLTTSLGEKVAFQEDIRVAAHRALAEELGITGELTVEESGSNITTEVSQSYPGLLTTRYDHFFSVALPPEHYNPEGYIEVQPDKSTYFVWQEVI